jgi:hypothetical protein
MGIGGGISSHFASTRRMGRVQRAADTRRQAGGKAQRTETGDSDRYLLLVLLYWEFLTLVGDGAKFCFVYILY